MPTKRTKENDIAIPAASAPVRRKSTTPRVKHSLKTSLAAATTEAGIAVEAVRTAIAYEPAEDEIAALAYTYWAGRGYQGGSAEEDWLRAEQELRAKATA